MTVIEGVLLEEKQRNLSMQESYKKELSSLPKGSIVIKKIGNKDYCYLKYREGKKVITKYAGQSSNLESLKNQIEKRKYFEDVLRKLDKEYKLISKVIKE